MCLQLLFYEQINIQPSEEPNIAFLNGDLDIDFVVITIVLNTKILKLPLELQHYFCPRP